MPVYTCNKKSYYEWAAEAAAAKKVHRFSFSYPTLKGEKKKMKKEVEEDDTVTMDGLTWWNNCLLYTSPSPRD